MTILFYTPFNARSWDTESLIEAFVLQGHRVLVLTQAAEGEYHERCRELGAVAFSYVVNKNSAVLYFLRHARHLVKFIKQHKVDVVYAHLENAGLPAVLSQYFTRAKVFACRHVVDEAYLLKSRRFILLNKIVYSLARQIIVVSERSKNFMVNREKINNHKIKVINLAYNFKRYPVPSTKDIEKIRNTYPCTLLLLTACRLMPSKRAVVSVEVLALLLLKGVDARLLVLGTGPDEKKIVSLIKERGLQEHVHLVGYKNNVMDYLSACDILLHPSVQDSSSVIIKEAGLCSKPVIACSGIGDVDDYLRHGYNAMLVSQNNTVNEMTTCVMKLLEDPQERSHMGARLREAVMARFDITGIIGQYNSIHNTLTT